MCCSQTRGGTDARNSFAGPFLMALQLRILMIPSAAWRLHHHLLAYVYNMHFASVDVGRKRCEDDDQWWCNEPDALGLPARLLPHALQCCRHAIDADIEGKLCRFHVYTWQSSVQPCMASAVVQFRLLVGLDFQRKVQNTNWIQKDPEKAQKQNKKWSNPKNKEKK